MPVNRAVSAIAGGNSDIEPAPHSDHCPAGSSSMEDADSLNQACKQVALRDGTAVRIRMARADDRPKLEAAFKELDPQTIYTRFFSFRRGISETEVERLEAADPDHYILLLATIGSGADETVIAAANCVVLDAAGPGRSAEIAFTVEEDYQRQGLASRMLAAITEIARSRGIMRFEADVLSHNQAMLAVFRRCGLPMTTSGSGGIVHLVRDLAAAAT
jgi:RimJ/RimL family protein N-acetyltransferase